MSLSRVAEIKTLRKLSEALYLIKQVKESSHKRTFMTAYFIFVLGIKGMNMIQQQCVAHCVMYKIYIYKKNGENAVSFLSILRYTGIFQQIVLGYYF